MLYQGDESDTLNESYICFRRREVKAVRKTRASQANTSERLNALQKQLHEPLQMAKAVLKREALKRESSHFSLNIWQRRVALVDLKRRTPSLGEKGDEELLIDKELPPLKKPDLYVSILPVFRSLTFCLVVLVFHRKPKQGLQSYLRFEPNLLFIQANELVYSIPRSRVLFRNERKRITSGRMLSTYVSLTFKHLSC